MNVKLIAHTTISDEFRESFDLLEDCGSIIRNPFDEDRYNERAAVALTAIRTCYSHNKPTEIIPLEAEKYFCRAASDGEGGTEADRLFRHISRSKHTSTLEHITYTFAVEGLSRAALAQLTRHRHMSFSVQSQRYVKLGSGDKSGGFDYVLPPSLEDEHKTVDFFGEDTSSIDIYRDFMNRAQITYDALRQAGVPAEDARMVLPQSTACNLILSANLRTFIEFYSKRRRGKGAQWEIADLAEQIRSNIVKVDEWTAKFFEEANCNCE